MKRIITIALSLIFISCKAQAQDVPPPLDLGPKEALKIIGGDNNHEFQVEIADSPQEQARGLMFREQMDDNVGMLFEFPAPKIASIWMQNTPLPLDILFVRENGQIMKIVHGAKPHSKRSMSSEGIVAAVLELNAGITYQLGIQPGHIVHHEFFGNVETKN